MRDPTMLCNAHVGRSQKPPKSRKHANKRRRNEKKSSLTLSLPRASTLECRYFVGKILLPADARFKGSEARGAGSDVADTRTQHTQLAVRSVGGGDGRGEMRGQALADLNRFGE